MDLCFARFVFSTFRGPLASRDSNPYPNRSRIARYNATKFPRSLVWTKNSIDLFQCFPLDLWVPSSFGFSWFEHHFSCRHPPSPQHISMLISNSLLVEMNHNVCPNCCEKMFCWKTCRSGSLVSPFSVHLWKSLSFNSAISLAVWAHNLLFETWYGRYGAMLHLDMSSISLVCLVGGVSPTASCRPLADRAFLVGTLPRNWDLSTTTAQRARHENHQRETLALSNPMVEVKFWRKKTSKSISTMSFLWESSLSREFSKGAATAEVNTFYPPN